MNFYGDRQYEVQSKMKNTNIKFKNTMIFDKNHRVEIAVHLAPFGQTHVTTNTFY